MLLMLLLLFVVVVDVDVVVVVVDVVVVVVCLLLLLLFLLLLLLLLCAARARAPNTSPKTDSNGARAHARVRREPAHTRKEREPTNSAKTMVFTMFLQQARKQKLKIRIVKQQKHCILRCFWPVGCVDSRSEKCLKHRNLQCFSLPLKTKQRYLRCFSALATPK